MLLALSTCHAAPVLSTFRYEDSMTFVGTVADGRCNGTLRAWSNGELRGEARTTHSHPRTGQLLFMMLLHGNDGERVSFDMERSDGTMVKFVNEVHLETNGEAGTVNDPIRLLPPPPATPSGRGEDGPWGKGGATSSFP